VEADAAPHGDVRCDALRGLLREVYALFALLHGRLRGTLDADASAETARRAGATGHTRTLTPPRCGRPALRRRRRADAAHAPRTRRRLLQPLVADFGARLSGGGKASELAGLSNALSAREGLPILPLDRQTFLNVQVRGAPRRARPRMRQRVCAMLTCALATPHTHACVLAPRSLSQTRWARAAAARWCSTSSCCTTPSSCGAVRAAAPCLCRHIVHRD
jgi:hypothetical protein